MGSQEEIKIENDFILIRFQNDGSENYHVKRPINQGLIQFHFGIKGKAKFVFNEGTYALELKDEKSLLFYNPQKGAAHIFMHDCTLINRKQFKQPAAHSGAWLFIHFPVRQGAEKPHSHLCDVPGYFYGQGLTEK